MFSSAEQLMYSQAAVSLSQLSGTVRRRLGLGLGLSSAPHSHVDMAIGPGMPALGAGLGPTPHPNLEKAVRGARRLKGARCSMARSWFSVVLVC